MHPRESSLVTPGQTLFSQSVAPAGFCLTYGMPRSSLAYLIIVALHVGRLAAAQSRNEHATLASFAGTVVVEVTREPVAGASVTLLELDRSATSDEKGAFLLSELPPGDYHLAVHRLGFDPLHVVVHLEPARRFEVDIELTRNAPVVLDPMAAHGEVDRQLGDILRRRATAQGTVFLRNELDSLRGTSVGELLRREAKGAKLIRYARTGALLVATGRGMGTISLLPLADPNDSRSPRACFAQVIVDGVRVYAPDAINRVPAPNLDQYDAATLEAVEFYAGPATTPPEFLGAGTQCGTLVLWTRRSR